MQNYKNHPRLNPFHHFIIIPLTALLFGWSLVNLFKDSSELNESLFAVLLAFSTVLISLIARTYALKNQDRIIRIEMRQRYFEMTSKSFSSKEKQLKLSQIIALRFAGDDELLSLIEKAISDKLSSKEIKLAITDWQGDYNRV